MQILRNADNSLIAPEITPVAPNPAFAPENPNPTPRVTVNSKAYPQYGSIPAPTAPMVAPSPNPVASPAPAPNLAGIPRAPTSSEIIAAAQQGYKEPGNWASAFAQGWTNAEAIQGKYDRERQDLIDKKAEEERIRGRQVEWLERMAPEYADAVKNRVMDAGDAFSMAKKDQAELRKGKEPQSAIGKLGYDLKNGLITQEVYDASMASLNAKGAQDSYRTLAPEEKTRLGLDPKGAFQIDQTGKISAIGGNGTTVNVGGEGSGDGALRKKLSEKEGEAWAGYKAAGTVSAGTVQDMQLIDELLTVAPQGPIEGRLAQMFPGMSSAGAAVESVVKRVAPTLRAPGSGATSDIEYDGMLRSLPSLSNKPEANRAISSMMKAKAELNVERSSIIDLYQNEQIDAGEARRRLDALNRQSIITPEIQKTFEGLGIDIRGSGDAPLKGDVVDGFRFKGGDPANEASWEKVQ